MNRGVSLDFQTASALVKRQKEVFWPAYADLFANPPHAYAVSPFDLPTTMRPFRQTGWKRDVSQDLMLNTQAFENWLRLGSAAVQIEQVSDMLCIADIRANAPTDKTVCIPPYLQALAPIKAASIRQAESLLVSFAPQDNGTEAKKQKLKTLKYNAPIPQYVAEDPMAAVHATTESLCILAATRGERILKSLFMGAVIRQHDPLDEVALKEDIKMFLGIQSTVDVLMPWHKLYGANEPKQRLGLPSPGQPT